MVGWLGGHYHHTHIHTTSVRNTLLLSSVRFLKVCGSSLLKVFLLPSVEDKLNTIDTKGGESLLQCNIFVFRTLNLTPPIIPGFSNCQLVCFRAGGGVPATGDTR